MGEILSRQKNKNFVLSVDIVVKDNKVEHWLNGPEIIEYECNNQVWSALITYSKFSNWPSFGKAVEANILLQDHGMRFGSRISKSRN